MNLRKITIHIPSDMADELEDVIRGREDYVAFSLSSVRDEIIVKALIEYLSEEK